MFDRIGHPRREENPPGSGTGGSRLVILAKAPFHESILEFINHVAPSDANTFVILCRLIERTKIPKDHEKIMDALEHLAVNGGHQYMDEFNAAMEALEDGLAETDGSDD